MDKTMNVLVGVQSTMEAAAKAQAANLNLNPFTEKIEHYNAEEFVNALFQLESFTLQELSDWYQSPNTKEYEIKRGIKVEKKGWKSTVLAFIKRNNKMGGVIMLSNFDDDDSISDEEMELQLSDTAKAGCRYFSNDFMKRLLDYVL